MMRWDLGSGGYFVSCVLPYNDTYNSFEAAWDIAVDDRGYAYVAVSSSQGDDGFPEVTTSPAWTTETGYEPGFPQIGESGFVAVISPNGYGQCYQNGPSESSRPCLPVL